MILILGGTSDSILLANRLFEASRDIILSTATEYGNEIASSSFSGKTTCGRMDEEALRDFCIDHRIHTIVDATHPYASIISENAIKVSTLLNLSYLRYERRASISQQEADEDVVICEDYEDAGRIANEREGNIFIATGSQRVERILQEIEEKSRVYVRVLPRSEQLLKLEALDLKPEQIIAMKGPFSLEMNQLMLREKKARILITKDSGAVGNTKEKIFAAKELNIQVILIQRPKIIYPNIFDSIDDIVHYLRR